MRVLLSVLLLSSVAAAQSDPLPVWFLPGGAETEECYAQWSTTYAVQAYSAPTAMSERLRTIDADRRIDANDYSESLTAILEPVVVLATSAMTVPGSRWGSQDSADVQILPGREILILSFGEEGLATFVYDGRVYQGYDGDLPPSDPSTLPGPGSTELWVRLVAHSADRPAAWLNTAQAGMVPREAFCE